VARGQGLELKEFFAVLSSLRGLWLTAAIGTLFWMVLPFPFVLLGISPALDLFDAPYFVGFDRVLQSAFVGAIIGFLLLLVIARLQSFREKKGIGYGLYFAVYIALLQGHSTLPLLFSPELLHPLFSVPQLMYSALLGTLTVLLISPLFARLIPGDILQDSLSFGNNEQEITFLLKVFLFFFPPSLAYLYFSEREKWMPFLGRFLRISTMGLLFWTVAYYIWSQSFLIGETFIYLSVSSSSLHSVIAPLLVRFGVGSFIMVCVVFVTAYCLSRAKSASHG